MFETLIGVGAGLFVRVWANSLGKQHFLARPWNHVIWGVAGGYVGYNYVKWEGQLLAAVNDKRKEKGFPVITRESTIPDISSHLKK